MGAELATAARVFVSDACVAAVVADVAPKKLPRHSGRCLMFLLLFCLFSYCVHCFCYMLALLWTILLFIVGVLMFMVGDL